MSGVPAVGQLAKVLKLGTCTIRSASLVSRDATASTCGIEQRRSESDQKEDASKRRETTSQKRTKIYACERERKDVQKAAENRPLQAGERR